MKYVQYSKKIDSLFGTLAILAFLAELILIWLDYEFIGLLVLGVVVSIMMIFVSVPSYDVMWRRQDIKPKVRFIWNITFKLLFAVIFIGSMKYFVIPYAMDIKPYLSKEYAIEKGTIQNIIITRDNRSVTSSVSIIVNGNKVRFDRLNPKSADSFRGLEQGDLVKLWYLPNSKYGIKIDVYKN